MLLMAGDTGGTARAPQASMPQRHPATHRAIPIALIGAILGPIAANSGLPEWLGLAVAIGPMRITGNDFAGVAGAVAVVAGARVLMG